MAKYKMKVKKENGTMEEITLPLSQEDKNLINGKASLNDVSNAGFIKNTNGAFNYNNLSNKPPIPTKPSDIGAQPSGDYATTLDIISLAEKVNQNTTKINKFEMGPILDDRSHFKLGKDGFLLFTCNSGRKIILGSTLKSTSAVNLVMRYKNSSAAYFNGSSITLTLNDQITIYSYGCYFKGEN